MKPNDPFIGRNILDGQFQIVQKIGAGGMGTVYKALQPEMSRMVAVKILHPKLTTRKDIVSRFRREAKALSHLTHPNTVRVLLYGELEDGPLYIVMEYLEGKNLNQLVRSEGPQRASRVVPMLVQAASALDEAHKAGIIHRDLKPENIFICKQGGLIDFVKVLDFGLAKVTTREMRPGSVVLTQEGMIFGTPEFMSPEQAQGLTLGAGSDVYSLAVILYEALTGKLPFDAKTPMEYLQMHVSAPPIPLLERGAGGPFPEGLWQVLEKALTKNPQHRFQSAAEFADALLAIPLTAAAASSAQVPANRATEIAFDGAQQATERDSALVVTKTATPGRNLYIAAICAFVLGVLVTALATLTLRK
jgi:eukaryotic-like serine/threonine-protein kinase